MYMYSLRNIRFTLPLVSTYLHIYIVYCVLHLHVSLALYPSPTSPSPLSSYSLFLHAHWGTHKTTDAQLL